MNASSRGVKHDCPECESKYYDLNKTDPVCPNCGAKPNTEPLLKSRPSAVSYTHLRAHETQSGTRMPSYT